MNNPIEDIISRIKRRANRDEVVKKIEVEKEIHASYPNFLNHHENLVKYIPKLQLISNRLSNSFYETPKKSNEMRRFTQLMTIRIRDYFETVILCIDLSRIGHSYSILPLIRALCESLILLKYVSEINPDYVNKLLESDEEGKRVAELRNKLNDKKINKYYKDLSNLVHINPISIQLTYDRSRNDGKVRIHQIPPNYELFNENTVCLLIDMMNDCLDVIEKINKEQVE